MQYIELFSSNEQEKWLEKIRDSEWGAGKLLYDWITAGKLEEKRGKNPEVLMLVDGENLASYCLFCEYDEVQPTELSPWIGFVFTSPSYRGKRLMGTLIQKAEEKAAKKGAEYTYISTGHVGLYEKYGYTFYGMEIGYGDEETRVYRKKVELSL